MIRLSYICFALLPMSFCASQLKLVILLNSTKKYQTLSEAVRITLIGLISQQMIRCYISWENIFFIDLTLCNYDWRGSNCFDLIDFRSKRKMEVCGYKHISHYVEIPTAAL